MHQPDYRDKLKGRAVLPWVRLHAVKDYYPMAALVDEFPGLRVTFNYVPSLLDQLEDYLAGRSLDEHLVLSTVAAGDLNQEGQIFLLRNFFMANHGTMIRPFPRYLELLEKRGPSGEQRHLESAQRAYGTKDYLDLQVLFNLSWFGPYFLKTDPLCRELAAKGQGFTEAEKGALLERQREIAGQVVPLLRRLVAEGRIEISTTPFYHPILPLLIDSDCARVAVPDAILPHQAFRHPEDARLQVGKAIAFHERAFGERPQGIWPSEGSVSPAVLQLFQDKIFFFALLGCPSTRSSTAPASAKNCSIIPTGPRPGTRRSSSATTFSPTSSVSPIAAGTPGMPSAISRTDSRVLPRFPGADGKGVLSP